MLPDHNFCAACGFELSRTWEKTAPASINIDGERKHVTVLFCDLSGYTAMSEQLDPEEVREISSTIFAEIANIIAGYQGFIEKFVGDAVLSIFGLPAVHEDDPIRAVKAARDIHRLVRSIRLESTHRIDLRLNMHSGIHTGLVVTGEMVVEKGIHGLVGDTLNLASRLADNAGPDEILVSPQTHRLIAPYFETEALQQHHLKGIAQPITPHKVVGELAVKTRFEAAKRHGLTPFIGRRQELAELMACLEKALAGNGQFVTLTGEAGMGKSRLVYEFRRSLDRQQVVVLQGQCHSYGSSIPYLPLLNALKRYLLFKEDDTPAQLENKTIASILAIDPSLGQYLPVYLHLLSIPSKKYPLHQHLQGQKLRSSISQALATMILLSAQRKPMILILEDWHWVDEASNSILTHLAGMMGPYPLMIVVLYRSESQTSWPDWDYRTSLALEAMEDQYTAQIIKSAWGADLLPDEFASFLHNHTGGNPFFVEEVCRALIEEGAVRIAEREAILLESAKMLNLPVTVQAVIRARLDRLDRHTRETLQLAAVIGREFPLRILEMISRTKSSLPMQLDTLKRQELIQPTRSIPDARYIFTHVLTQITAYESLLLKKRKRFHALVGLSLERLHADRLEEQCENLAHHYSNSSDTKKALFYLDMAGTKAARVHSLSEARQACQTALSILETDTESGRNRQKYIDFALKWAEVSQYAPSNRIKRALIRSLEYAKNFAKPKRVAEVSYWIGRTGYMQGDFVEAIPRIEHCIKTAGEQKDHELLAVSTNLRGRACVYTCDYAKGIDYLNTGLELIKPFEKWDDIAYSMAILGLMTGITGNYKNSLKTIAKAIRIAHEHEIPTFEAMAFGYLGTIQYYYGNWNATINNCNKCIEVSRKLGNSLPIIWAIFFKGAALFNSGEQKAGLTAISRSIEMITGLDSVLALRFFYSLYGENLAVHGNYREAESANRKAIALGQSGQIWGEIASCRTMAILAAAGSNPDWRQVKVHMHQSIEISTRTGAVTELSASLYRFAELMHRKGDQERARVYYHQWRDLTDKMGCRGAGRRALSMAISHPPP